MKSYRVATDTDITALDTHQVALEAYSKQLNEQQAELAKGKKVKAMVGGPPTGEMRGVNMMNFCTIKVYSTTCIYIQCIYTYDIYSNFVKLVFNLCINDLFVLFLFIFKVY